MYEPGSQVANGLAICAAMDQRHHLEGRMAWQTGDTSNLWSVQHWAGYQAAQTEAAADMRFPGAPDDWPTVQEVEAIKANCAAMRDLSTLPVTGWATIDSQGFIEECDGEWDGDEVGE